MTEPSGPEVHHHSVEELFAQKLWDASDDYSNGLPFAFNKPEIFKYLSADGQAHFRCGQCGTEFRAYPGLINGDDLSDGFTCNNDGSKLESIVHAADFTSICLVCFSFDILPSGECVACGCHATTVIDVIAPPYPETFGQLTYPALNHTWGNDAITDTSIIQREIGECAIFPDSEQHAIALALFAERLSQCSYGQVGKRQLRNLSALLLCSNFKITGDISAGITAFKFFLQCVEGADSGQERACYQLNAARAAFSLLTKQDPLVLAVTSNGEKLRLRGVELAEDSLKQPEMLDANFVAKIQWLIGDLYCIGIVASGEARPKLAEEALLHYDKALSDPTGLSDAERAQLRLRRSQVSHTNSAIQAPGSDFEFMLESIDWRKPPGDLWVLLLNKGTMLSATAPDAAFEWYKAAIYLTSARVGNANDPKALGSMARLYVHAHDEYACLAAQRLSPIRALAVTEVVRAAGVREASSDDFSRNRRRLEMVGSRIVSVLTGQVNNISEATARGEAVLEQLETGLRRTSGKLLPKGWVFATLVVSRSKVTVLVAKRRGARNRLHVVPHQWSVDNEFVDAFTTSIHPHREIAGPFREPHLQELCDAMSRIFGAELSFALRQEGAKGVIISAPGWLSHLPFEALKLQDTSGSLLIDEFQVRYLPSLLLGQRLFERQKGQRSPHPRLLVVDYGGDDLPESVNEVESLRQRWGGRITVLPGKSSTRDSVLHEMAQPYSHIHIVCHGTFDEVHPLQSSLLLRRGSEGKDNVITASDLLRLSMPLSPVVSLSACSSALTAFGATNDLTGLPGSLMRAGARGIVGSRWPVYDSTAAKFMTGYLGAIADAVPPARAVRENQLLLRGWGGIEDWGAFGYIGVD